ATSPMPLHAALPIYAHRGADDPGFGERGVDDALGAEGFLQAIGDAEDAAEGADVLADQEHVVVRGKDVVQGRVQGFRHGHRDHEVLPAAARDASKASIWARWRARPACAVVRTFSKSDSGAGSVRVDTARWRASAASRAWACASSW